MANSPKVSTKSKKTPKSTLAPIETFQNEYYRDMHTLRMSPISKDYLEKFALEWISHALADDDMLTVNDFLLKKGVSKGTVQQWYERVPEFKEAYNHIVTILGNRRERGSIKRQYDSATILRSQHMYDDAWRAADEWRANLTAKANGSGSGNVIVEMHEFQPPKENK